MRFKQELLHLFLLHSDMAELEMYDQVDLNEAELSSPASEICACDGNCCAS